SAGSMDHLKFPRFAKAYGVDVTKINYVSEQDGGELKALVIERVDVLSTSVALKVEEGKARKVKELAIKAEERLESETIEDFETAKEQGIDETYVNWRGFMGPPDLEPEEVAYYEEAFKALTESDAWKEIRLQYGWDDMY